MVAYKSFCWALGTTSFRTTEFNKKVEKQLKLIKSFWDIEENARECWSSNSHLQIKTCPYALFISLINLISFFINSICDNTSYKAFISSFKNVWMIISILVSWKNKDKKM